MVKYFNKILKIRQLNYNQLRSLYLSILEFLSNTLLCNGTETAAAIFKSTGGKLNGRYL
jgi:hypothetical protein